MAVAGMIWLICPHCLWGFPVMAVPSRGWCRCGVEYEIIGGLRGLTINWLGPPVRGAPTPP